MIEITHAEASAAILAHVAGRTLVQGLWHDRADGREMACLLGAIHPSVESPAECNGDLMPMWLAELTPVLFDGMPAGEIFTAARRYGELVGRWHALSSTQWDAILTRVLIRCIDDAVNAARPAASGKNYWPAVEAAGAQSKAAIESGAARAAASAARAARAAWAAGDAAWAAAGAAGAAAWAAAWAAGDAARAAASAAEAAAWAAGGAAGAAARAAASAADRAAWAAGAAARAAASAADRAAWAAGGAARAAYLSLFNFVLDQIEAECGA